MAINYLTLIHVAISLAGIATGFGALACWIGAKSSPGWTHVFLAMTIATSVTGFFFPFRGVTPGIVVGVISLVVLAISCYALYARRLAGVWRLAFVLGSVAALYLNFFVLVAQLFQKTPALAELAPTQSAPAFVATNLVVLAVFGVLGFAAARGFRAV